MLWRMEQDDANAVVMDLLEAPHLLAQIHDNPVWLIAALSWMGWELSRRYELLVEVQAKNVRMFPAQRGAGVPKATLLPTAAGKIILRSYLIKQS